MYQLTHFLSAELPRIDFKIDNYIFLQLQSSIFIRLYPSELIMCFDILLHQNNLFFYSFQMNHLQPHHNSIQMSVMLKSKRKLC